ncbi:MAG: DUF4230 domain-containing protein [Bacteroidota bacterium]
MKKVSPYLLFGILGFLIAMLIYKKDPEQDLQEDTRVVMHSINNLSKLIVTEAIFSEVYNYKSARKYFYDTFEFNKSAIVTVNAKAQVQYDLERMDVEVDSIHKQIKIRFIPEPDIIIIPDVKYFDIQQSTFNTFSKDELNQINKKSIDKIKETAEVGKLKEKAKERLFIELSKIYQLSAILDWEVIDATDTHLLDTFVIEKPKL